MDSPGVQTLLGAAGACPEIVHCGKTWRIGHPTQRAKAVLEELAVAKATAEVRALKTVVPAEAYAELFAELVSRISVGDYRTWGSGWQRIVFGGANAHLFLLALLREHHAEAAESDARALALAEPERVQAALMRVVPGFLSVLLAGLPLSPDQRGRIESTVLEAFRPPPSMPTSDG